MKIKTSELTGDALDWSVAKCEGVDGLFEAYEVGRHHFSTEWSQGGPIIEREKLDLWWCAGNGFYTASNSGGNSIEDGPTPLIAAMRCYVASKLGDEVEVPDYLV